MALVFFSHKSRCVYVSVGVVEQTCDHHHDGRKGCDGNILIKVQLVTSIILGMLLNW